MIADQLYPAGALLDDKNTSNYFKGMVTDQGCEYSSKCTECPLPRCKHDGPVYADVQQLKKQGHVFPSTNDPINRSVRKSRQTCPQGHPYDPVVDARGFRTCTICINAASLRRSNRILHRTKEII